MVDCGAREETGEFNLGVRASITVKLTQDNLPTSPNACKVKNRYKYTQTKEREEGGAGFSEERPRGRTEGELWGCDAAWKT